MKKAFYFRAVLLIFRLYAIVEQSCQFRPGGFLFFILFLTLQVGAYCCCFRIGDRLRWIQSHYPASSAELSHSIIRQMDGYMRSPMFVAFFLPVSS